MWKKFSLENGLNSHKNTRHQGFKDFECQESKTKFCQKSNLRQNINTKHEILNIFEWKWNEKECKKKFTQTGNRKSHVVTVQQRRKDFQCKEWNLVKRVV